MFKILFNFINDNDDEFRFIWDLNVSNDNNVDKLLELSDSWSFQNFLKKFEPISFIFNGKEYENIGKFLEYIIYEEINDDEGISIANIIKMSDLFNKNIKEIINIIDYSNTCVLFKENHIYALEKMSKSYNISRKQYTNIYRLMQAYDYGWINFTNLTKIIKEENINIIPITSNLIFYFIPLNNSFNKETSEFEKDLEKYYNPDMFVFKNNSGGINEIYKKMD
jgi:hypothetical protein